MNDWQDRVQRVSLWQAAARFNRAEVARIPLDTDRLTDVFNLLVI
jgi:hypothetical protein